MSRVVTWIAVSKGASYRGVGRVSSKFASSAALVLGLLLPSLVGAQSWQHLYDEVGRLKSAIAPSGDRTDYEYDAVGNIIAIRRSAAGALNISEFSPQIGKGGTSVIITGSGFSTTLANNVVKFNGVTAAVSAATATQLTVTAPNTGTTGTISVTVGASTVTARESFVYSSTVVTGPPTIASTAPTCALPGTVVALTGTNFDVAPGATRVELGNFVASTTVTSPTSLSLIVPVGTGSAQPRVVTPLGFSALAAPLFVPPTNACADYEAQLRPVRNGAPGALSIVTAGKKAVVLFSGTAGEALTLHFSNLAPSVSGGTLGYTTYNPLNAYIDIAGITPTDASMHAPLLPTTGTYATVLYWYPTSATGTASVQFQSNAALATNGTALNVTIAAVGQSQRVTFAAAGQDLTIYVPPYSLPGVTMLAYTVRQPNQVETTAYCQLDGASCASSLRPLLAGPHTAKFVTAPRAAGTFQVKAWASNRVGVTLPIGTTVVTTSTIPGQMVQSTINLSAGQLRRLSLANFTTSISGATLYARVLQPDGSHFASTTFIAANTTPTPRLLDLPTITTPGNYIVQIFPYVTGNVQMTTTFSGQTQLQTR